jgi:Synaptotagmin-like mitochondrial-lipid-binding domain/C2 domain
MSSVATLLSSHNMSAKAASSRIIAPAMLGFVLGVGASFVSAVAMYIWYYSRPVPAPDTKAKRTTIEAASLEDSSFLSDIVAALWKHINAVAISQIQETCQPIFEQMNSYPFNNLRFTRITLGDVPIRMDHVKVHACQKNPLTKQDGVQISLDLVWDGACDIQLKSSVGPFGIQFIQLKGRLSLLLQPLSDASSSIVGAVQYSFVNTPELTLVDFTGLAQVADLQSIKKTIQSSILKSIEEMMVLPVRSILRMDTAVSYLQIYQPPVGVARITLQKGAGFSVSASTLGGLDIPDMYCILRVGETVWTSVVVPDSVEPVWGSNASFDVLLHDVDQILQVTVLDQNRGTLLGTSDAVLGTAVLTVGQLLAHTVQNIPLCDAKKGAFTGASIELRGDLFSLVPELDSLAMPSAAEIDPVDSDTSSTCGLITVVISQAFDLPIAEQTSYIGDASHVRVAFGSSYCFTAVAVVPGVHPTYDCACTIPLTRAMLQDAQGNLQDLPPIVVSVLDGVPSAKENGADATHAISHCYGTIEISCTELLESTPDYIRSGRKSLGTQTAAQVELLVALQGVQRAPPHGNATPTPVRLTVRKGWGFVPERRPWAADDVPDVYCVVQFGSHPAPWRTSTIANSTTPAWNESHTFLLPDRAQIVRVDVWDQDKGAMDADDHWGHFRVSVGKLLAAPNGTLDCEVLLAGQPTQSYIQLQCAWVPL